MAGSLERRQILGYLWRIGDDREAILLARLEEVPDVTVLERCAWLLEHHGQDLRQATMWGTMCPVGWMH